MKFGIALPNNHGVPKVRQLVELAQYCERLGFNSVWTSEHLFHSSYVEQRLGKRPYHEALTTLTAVAASTSRVRLGTSVLVLPWHHPVRLAKTIASLDDLSAGRINLGVGVAITDDEYRNLGADYEQRGRVADDILGALRALWTQEWPSFQGSHHQFSGLRFEPKPVQSPLPIYVGGSSPAALRRVRRFGQVWHPLGLSCAELIAAAEHAKLGPDIGICPRMTVEFVAETGQRALEDRRSLRGTAAEIQALIAALEQAGVAEVVLDPATGDLGKCRETLEQIHAIFQLA